MPKLPTKKFSDLDATVPDNNSQYSAAQKRAHAAYEAEIQTAARARAGAIAKADSTYNAATPAMEMAVARELEEAETTREHDRHQVFATLKLSTLPICLGSLPGVIGLFVGLTGFALMSAGLVVFVALGLFSYAGIRLWLIRRKDRASKLAGMRAIAEGRTSASNNRQSAIEKADLALSEAQKAAAQRRTAAATASLRKLAEAEQAARQRSEQSNSQHSEPQDPTPEKTVMMFPPNAAKQEVPNRSESQRSAPASRGEQKVAEERAEGNDSALEPTLFMPSAKRPQFCGACGRRSPTLLPIFWGEPGPAQQLQSQRGEIWLGGKAPEGVSGLPQWRCMRCNNNV